MAQVQFAEALLTAADGASIVGAAFDFLGDNALFIVAVLGPMVGYKIAKSWVRAGLKGKTA